MARGQRKNSTGGALRESAAASAPAGSVRITGMGRFGPEEMTRMSEKKDQASCVVDGEFPIDFGTFRKTSGNLFDVQVGDKIAIRQNSGTDYGEKNRQRIIGRVEVAGTVHHSFSEEEASSEEAVRKRLGKIWDENNLGTKQKIFTRDRFLEYGLEGVQAGERNFALLLYKNERRLSSPIENPGKTNKEQQSHIIGPLGGGKLLREGEGYQEIVDAVS